MVSEALTKFTGSLVALDELIERERASAAKVIEAAFQHDIHVAIIRVGEINKVASARIVAAAQVAAAKAATDAEVGAATLASLANSALSRLSDRAAHGLFSREDANAIMNAASELAGEEIGVYASEAINAIASEAEAAVKK